MLSLIVFFLTLVWFTPTVDRRVREASKGEPFFHDGVLLLEDRVLLVIEEVCFLLYVIPSSN